MEEYGEHFITYILFCSPQAFYTHNGNQQSGEQKGKKFFVCSPKRPEEPPMGSAKDRIRRTIQWKSPLLFAANRLHARQEATKWRTKQSQKHFLFAAKCLHAPLTPSQSHISALHTPKRKVKKAKITP